jgi:sec-independent protein translocase protein TatC
LLLAFGLVFELPIVIFFLARLGIVDHHWLAKNRKYALLLAFVVGAVLTPPDVISQLSLAVPFLLLYEVGIVVARLFGAPTVDREE